MADIHVAAYGLDMARKKRVGQEKHHTCIALNSKNIVSRHVIRLNGGQTATSLKHEHISNYCGKK